MTIGPTAKGQHEMPSELFIRLTNQLMRYPLNAWEADELKTAEQALQTLPSSSERAWWLNYVRQEIERRTPPPWWPIEWQALLDPGYHWHTDDRGPIVRET